MKYRSLLLAAALSGCANERYLAVESEPPGAMVDAKVNDSYSTWGRTPTKGFITNGRPDEIVSLGVRKEGYYPELREIKYRDMRRAGIMEFTLRKIPEHTLQVVTVPPGGEVEAQQRRRTYDPIMEGWFPRELVWVHEELPMTLLDEEGTGKVRLRIFKEGYHTVEGLYPMNAGTITVPLEKVR